MIKNAFVWSTTIDPSVFFKFNEEPPSSLPGRVVALLIPGLSDG